MYLRSMRLCRAFAGHSLIWEPNASIILSIWPVSRTTIHVHRRPNRELDNLYNVHFKGVFFLTQKILPLMNDGGRIVNIASGLTRIVMPGSCAYASMKGAVEIMTRYLALELGPRRIAVNVVAPGAMATDFSGGMVRDNPEMNKRVADMTALAVPASPRTSA